MLTTKILTAKLKSRVYINPCLDKYLYTLFLLQMGKPDNIIRTHGLRKMCVSRAGLNKQELKRKCFNNILFGADNPGVCTRRFNNRLCHILLIHQSGLVVFFPSFVLVSCRTFSHMTTNILFPGPTEINPRDMKKLLLLLSILFLIIH